MRTGAATGCQVSYAISSQWSGGFGANVNVTNLGDPVNGWRSNATHNLVAVKDPSVVRFNGTYYVLMSTVDSNGNYNMAQASFTDWSQAGNASLFYLDQTPIGGGYKTAPTVFYFAPQRLWYLTYQTGGNMAYSTNPDISNPAGWSAPHNFYSNGTPSIIQQNIGSGFWVDSWVIRDSAHRTGHPDQLDLLTVLRPGSPGCRTPARRRPAA